MKTIVIAAGAAAMLMAGGAAEAGPKGQDKAGTSAATPAQPIPYAQLDAYLRASARQRATRDWWSGSTSSAAAGVTAETTRPDNAGGPAGAVNPPIDSGPAGLGASSAGAGSGGSPGSPTGPAAGDATSPR